MSNYDDRIQIQIQECCIKIIIAYTEHSTWLQIGYKCYILKILETIDRYSSAIKNSANV